MIDILNLRNKVIAEYRKYVESFLDIRDERLRDFARELLDRGDLWPDPLLQCNPGFEKGETIDELIGQEVLHRDMARIFTGFHLHKHQAEAIKIGSAGSGFIVTSGTGSGKSLTYLGTIFNHVLKQPQPGVKAIIVYPMNALINSQEEEIKKFQRNYLRQQLGPDSDWSPEDKTLDEQVAELAELTEQPFPITFGKYTGQEDEAAKKAILENPPHILLTNYMMLELLLTRSREAELRASIFAALQFLVFDELHTYRGRQGADVALLIRRMKALARNNPICMGTSATLSSGSISQQKKDVAHLGKQLFDEDFGPDQIIMESLQARITRPLPSASELKDSLNQRLPIEEPLVALEAHPLTCWMEQEVALSNNEGTLVRGTPQTVQEIAEKLAAASGAEAATCKQRISEVLQWLQHVNQDLDDGILPFRVHQFVSQTGTIRVTLEPAAEREITTKEELTISKNGTQLPLFPVVFNRHSGLPYIRVQLVNGELKPWENGIERSNPKNNENAVGYLLLDEPGDQPLWDDDRAQELVPDTWIEKRKSGNRIRKERAEALPKPIWFLADGTCSFEQMPGAARGWFMAARLLLDPLSGVIYDSRIREFNKLAQLGDAGRSTSTTILSYSTLRQLENQQAADKMRKVMSFTDNRQDAALQTGHFNDFMRQALLRAAICGALEQHQSRDSSNIAAAVFEALALPESAYAEKPGTRPHQVRDNEAIFKKWLLHQLFFDLRRGWRHRLPNLEQCGLLEIRYKNLREDCSIDKYWEGSDFLHALDANSRFEFVRQFLNYFRSAFAVRHHELERVTMEESQNRMREKLKPGWMYQHEDDPREPYWMRVEPFKSKTLHTLSIGPASSLGQYVRFFAKQHGKTLEHKDVADEMPRLLQCFTEAGYLYCNTELAPVPLYRLELSTIEWIPGDPENMVLDEVRNRSAKQWRVKPNAYFRELYQQLPEHLKQLEAREHTGQVPAEDRQEIERQFRKAEIKALFCSPTMELGIDIDELAVVHMRNVPPNPANYAQRSGRAGRKGQGALIFTFCSEHSAHDRHFFRKKMEMVTGKVAPQMLDLTNPELVRTHLHAAYLAKCSIAALNRSLAEVLDLSDPRLPILPQIQRQLELSFEAKASLHKEFSRVVAGLGSESEFTSKWITHTMEEVPRAFDEACQRWRDLYTEAFNAKTAARSRLGGAHLTKSDPEYQENTARMHQSQRKLDLLRNKAGFKKRTNKEGNGKKAAQNTFSEFYPYRYLASEGFLPGYDFTRLPIRLYLDDSKGNGTYISKPRFEAITEFGPHNTLYQNGSKWRVGRMSLPPSEGELQMQQLLIDKATGYFSLGDATRSDINPFSGAAQSDSKAHHALPNMVELHDMTAWAADRISCQEDERTSTKFSTDLGFAIRTSDSRAAVIDLRSQDDTLLRARYFPGASLIKINHKPARNQGTDSFLIDAQKGIWRSESDKKNKKLSEDDLKAIKNVRLFTSVTADCLYIEPRALQLSAEGVVTLMFALKEAIQLQYQVEPQELSCMLQGDGHTPNILFYESAEGNLGILSRLAADGGQWQQLIKKATEICRLDEDPNETPAATYEDLLSYYNQPFHDQINRFHIKRALEQLGNAEVELQAATRIEPVFRTANSNKNEPA